MVTRKVYHLVINFAATSADFTISIGAFGVVIFFADSDFIV